MSFMRKASWFLLAPLLCCLYFAPQSLAQDANGSLDLTAHASPTAARPEPVRQVTLYVLTKSYTDIMKDVETEEAPPSREKFIDGLKVSPELKEWLRAHDAFDLTAPDLD
jgi:hypothetical protein